MMMLVRALWKKKQQILLADRERQMSVAVDGGSANLCRNGKRQEAKAGQPLARPEIREMCLKLSVIKV